MILIMSMIRKPSRADPPMKKSPVTLKEGIIAYDYDFIPEIERHLVPMAGDELFVVTLFRVCGG